jgi:hypothetical protein
MGNGVEKTGNLRIMQVAHEFSVFFSFFSAVKISDTRRDDVLHKKGSRCRVKLCVSLIKMHLAQKHGMRKKGGKTDLCGTQIDHNLCNVLHACLLCNLYHI